jgi:hypothetical protein
MMKPTTGLSAKFRVVVVLDVVADGVGDSRIAERLLPTFRRIALASAASRTNAAKRRRALQLDLQLCGHTRAVQIEVGHGW